MRMTQFSGAILMLLGVALGAFGAHALAPGFDARALGWWNTAVQYQFIHAVGLIAIGAVVRRGMALAAALLFAGTVIFCGTLYLLALGGPLWLGMVTPTGGTLMLGGWAAAAIAFWRGIPR